LVSNLQAEGFIGDGFVEDEEDDLLIDMDM